MTPKSTLAAAHFLMENTNLSINNVTADFPACKDIGMWHIANALQCHQYFNLKGNQVGFSSDLYQTHEEIEQLARSIGWQGEGE